MTNTTVPPPDRDPINVLFRLDGQVAIVTGGTGGIGEAVCRLLATAGASIACLDIDERRVHATADQIKKQGGEAIGVVCDVSSESDVQSAVQQTVSALGRPTVFVNSVAMTDRSGTILDVDPAHWEAVHRVNLTGAYLTSRAVLPHMIAAGHGSIIHIGSMLTHISNPGRVSYSSAKGALRQLVKVMAVDHALQGVRVNTLSPGPIDTDRIAYRQQHLTEDEKKGVIEHFPLKRMGSPDEIAAATLFLASAAASFITGADLVVDGACSIVLN